MLIVGIFGLLIIFFTFWIIFLNFIVGTIEYDDNIVDHIMNVHVGISHPGKIRSFKYVIFKTKKVDKINIPQNQVL